MLQKLGITLGVLLIIISSCIFFVYLNFTNRILEIEESKLKIEQKYIKKIEGYVAPEYIGRDEIPVKSPSNEIQIEKVSG